MTSPLPTSPLPTSPPTTSPPPERPAAPRRALGGAVTTGLAATLLLRAGSPGVGVALFAVVAAVVAVVVTVPGHMPVRRRGWQVVHGACAVLLCAAAAVRDAPWVVLVDLAAAPLLATVALSPAATWTSVLTAPVRAAVRCFPATAWLARGASTRVPRGEHLGSWVRAVALTLGLLAVFVPLLASADSRFAALVPRLPDAGTLPARLATFIVFTVLAGAALHLAARPPRELTLGPAGHVLRRTSEWLLPLAALDVVFALFLAVQTGGHRAATYADAVHAGFVQLLVATGLVTLVVAGAVRWTTRSRGVRAALGTLCLLTGGVDAIALARLHTYVDAYGLTRLRIVVAVTCLALGAVLALLVVAGAQRPPARWVPNAVVSVASAALLGLTLANPDAAIARSVVAQGAAADTAYASTLSADAVPALLHLPSAERDRVLDPVLASASSTRDEPWTSANLSRHRARALLDARSTPTRSGD